MRDHNENRESPPDIYEEAQQIVWARYDLSVTELSQLSLDSRVISLCQALKGISTHYHDFCDEENVDLLTDDPGAADHVVGAKLMLFGALDDYAEDILGYVPDTRGTQDVKDEIDALQRDLDDDPHTDGGGL